MMRVISLLSLFAAFAPSAAVADPVGEYGYYMGGHSWAGMIFGPIFMILFLVVAVAAVVLVLRWMGVFPSAHKSGPLRTLEERFARGEIDAAEFAERKKALEG